MSTMAHVVTEAHDETTGDITAAGLRRAFHLSTSEVAGIAGISARGARNATSARSRARYERFMASMVRLRRLLGGEMSLVRIWLRSPHPDLGGRTPASYLVEGKLAAIEMLLHDAETGQTA